MKLTAQEEYGLRCILTLAREEEQAQEHLPGNGDDSPSGSALSSASGPDRYLTVGDISRLEGISQQYAGKLIRILGKAGLVLSVRGCKGGYRLARKASKIRVSEVLDVLGSKIYDPDLCDRHRGDRPFCVHSNDCAVRSLWTGIQLLVDQVLSNTSLHELISSERTMAQWMVDHLETVGPGMGLPSPEAPARVETEPGRVETGTVQVENFTGNPVRNDEERTF